MRLVFLFQIIVCAAYCQSEEEQIKKASGLFSKLYLEGKINEMVEAYTEDALLFPPSRDVLMGKKAIAQYWHSLPALKIIVHRSEPLQIRIKGKEAHEYGYYYSQSQKSDGSINPVFSAKYYIIWRKEKGTWKMNMDMWNGRNPDWSN